MNIVLSEQTILQENLNALNSVGSWLNIYCHKFNLRLKDDVPQSVKVFD